MNIPRIKVITRFIKSDSHLNGFPLHCLKYSDTNYSSNFGIDKVIKEETIYEGVCPSILRIMPKVDTQYLYSYINFISQLVPTSIDWKIANAVRHTCGLSIFYDTDNEKKFSYPCMYDGQSYLPNGIIISDNKDGMSDELTEYLHMFFTKDDYDRIQKFEDIGIENWNYTLYEEMMKVYK